MKNILTTFAAVAAFTPALLFGQRQENIAFYDDVLRPNFTVEISSANAFFEGPESEPVPFVLTPVTMLELLEAPEGSRMWWLAEGPGQARLVVADSSGDILNTVAWWSPISVFAQEEFFGPYTPLLLEQGTRGVGLTLNMAMYWVVGDIEVLTLMRQGTSIRFGRSSAYVRMRSQAFLGDGSDGEIRRPSSDDIVVKGDDPEEGQLYMVTKGSFSFSGRLDDGGEP